MSFRCISSIPAWTPSSLLEVSVPRTLPEVGSPRCPCPEDGLQLTTQANTLFQAGAWGFKPG